MLVRFPGLEFRRMRPPSRSHQPVRAPRAHTSRPPATWTSAIQQHFGPPPDAERHLFSFAAKAVLTLVHKGDHEAVLGGKLSLLADCHVGRDVSLLGVDGAQYLEPAAGRLPGLVIYLG